MKKLTPLQKRLVDIYVSMEKPNKGKAYELAGYKCSGETARTEAEKTLRKPHVKSYLQKLEKQSTNKAVEISGINKAKVLTDIERVRQKAEDRYSLHTALRASELQGKHLKMFTDKIEADIGKSFAQAIHEAMNDEK